MSDNLHSPSNTSVSQQTDKELSYNDLILYYEQNKDKPLEEWLVFDRTLDKPGKQGLIGLLKLDPTNSYIFKISQYINYLVQHELTIMKGLNDISRYCPHFCRSIGSITCKLDPRNRKSGNPFLSSSKYLIEKEVLLCEFIDKSTKFYNYIRSSKIHEDVLYSSIKQVLLSLSIAQNKKQFSHYDLHSLNIMMKRCNKDVVFLYALDDSNQFCVPTLGHYPVIIDFGFSYIKEMEDGPLWASLAHTDVGFMSDRFDWVADPKLFLVTVSCEIKEKRNTRKSKRLRRIVKNIFHPLSIDWDCAWDTIDERGATDYVLEILEDHNDISTLFDDYEHYCIDIVQSLIILPLEEQNYSDISKSYTTFLKEFVKIENEISSPFYNLYILKNIVDAARTYRPDYMSRTNRNQAINAFRTSVYTTINKVTKFCNPKNINFEKMLCSLFVLSRNIEGILFDVVSTQMAKKQKEYNKLPLQSVEQIYGCIDSNIPDNYIYNENTEIVIIDAFKESYDSFKIPSDQLDIVNETHRFARGTFIYSMYQNQQQT